MIYFIECGKNVKIGYAKSDVDKRIAILQTGNASEFKVLKVIEGSLSLEKAIHKKLSAHHVRGEWYKLNQEVREAIKNPIGEDEAGLTLLNKNIGFKCSEVELEYFSTESKRLGITKSELFRRMVRAIEEMGGLHELEKSLGY